MNNIKKKYLFLRVTRKLMELQNHFAKMKTAAILLEKYNGNNMSSNKIDEYLEMGMIGTEDSVEILKNLKKNVDKIVDLI